MSFRGFLDNARREAAGMAQGLFPAAQAIGQQAVNDVDTLVFEKGLGLKPRKKTPKTGSFGLDNLGKTAAVGWANDTPILPLLRGDIKEAGQRFYDLPISSTFDLIGAGSAAGQGLRLGSKIPGSLGESALKMRGYQKADVSSLGLGTTVGEYPTRFKMADGTEASGREYLMRMQDQTHDGNLWLKKTMRSAKPSGDATFDKAVDTAETLADDPLTLQATPRARFEPFAKVGDMMHFGPTLGSKRFGRRLTIKNQSRLKVSVNEMMGLHGVMKKQIEQQFGKDAMPVAGDTLLAHAAGFHTGASLDDAPKAFEPSGRKAVLTDKGVDLKAKEGNVVELNNSEFRLAEMTVKLRDLMLDELAKDIEKLNESGYSVVLTGGKNGDRVLSPAQVRAGGDALAYKLPNRNLFIKKGFKEDLQEWQKNPLYNPPNEPKSPMEQGSLFNKNEHVGDKGLPKDRMVDDLPTKPEGTPVKMFADRNLKVGDSTYEIPEPTKILTRWDEPSLKDAKHPYYKDRTSGELVSVTTDNLAYPRNPNHSSRLSPQMHDISDKLTAQLEKGLISADEVRARKKLLMEKDGLSEVDAKEVINHVLNRAGAEQLATEVNRVGGNIDDIVYDNQVLEGPGKERPTASLEDVDTVDSHLEDFSVSMRKVLDEYFEGEGKFDSSPLSGKQARILARVAMQEVADANPALKSSLNKVGPYKLDATKQKIIASQTEYLKSKDPSYTFDEMDDSSFYNEYEPDFVDEEHPLDNRPDPRRGSKEESEAAFEEAFGGAPPRSPFESDPVAFGDDAPAAWQKKLRAKTAENYGQMTWFKNYLDQMVQARVNDGPDITYRFKSIAQNPRVREMLDSDFFKNEILPKHQTMIAAQLEADRVRLGANALSQDNVVRNTDRLAMLFGNEGQGSFFVARPKYGVKKPIDRIKGDSDIEVIDENLPGDPEELIAKGILDTSPEVHLNNYLRRKNDASKQELSDSVADASVTVTPDQTKSYVSEGIAVTEENWKKGGEKTKFVIIEPNGTLFKQIENMLPLANQAMRRLREDGYHTEADNIGESAKQMFQASEDGDFSLGDMIRNPKLRGEIDDTRYMVPREMYEAIRGETDNSTNALSSFLQATSTGFKVSVLHGRWPSWVLNNTIGAHLYLALTGGTGRMIPHAGGGHMVSEFFPDVLGASSREMSHGADDLGRVAQGRVDKLLESKPGKMATNAINTLGDWNQKIADDPARLARLQQVVEERFQSTQRLAKARGMEIPDTLESRRKMLMDQTVREDIAAEVLDDLIDFTTLSKSERMWWSNVIPFWTFIKGSTKSTVRTLADHPGRVWPLQELGSLGADITDKTYESGTPEYMRALLPVANGQALSVGGWNPWSQQSSLFSLGAQIASANMPTGQEHPFSMLNPAITIPLEAINKRDTYTQYPLEGNIAQIIGSGVLESFPLGENLKDMLIQREITGREVFPHSKTNSMLNFVGVPVRDVNESNMNVRMQTDENRRKKNGTYDYWRFHNGV